MLCLSQRSVPASEARRSCRLQLLPLMARLKNQYPLLPGGFFSRGNINITRTHYFIYRRQRRSAKQAPATACAPPIDKLFTPRRKLRLKSLFDFPWASGGVSYDFLHSRYLSRNNGHKKRRRIRKSPRYITSY